MKTHPNSPRILPSRIGLPAFASSLLAALALMGAGEARGQGATLGTVGLSTTKSASFEQTGSGTPTFLEGSYSASGGISPYGITVENFTATVPKTGNSTPQYVDLQSFGHSEEFTDSLEALNNAYIWSGAAEMSFELRTSPGGTRLSTQPDQPATPGTDYAQPSYSSIISMGIMVEDGVIYGSTVDVPEIVGGTWVGGKLLLNASADATITHNYWPGSAPADFDDSRKLEIFDLSDNFVWSDSQTEDSPSAFTVLGSTRRNQDMGDTSVS